MDAPAALATPIEAAVIHAEIRRLGVTHVPLVPDKHQQTLVASLLRDSELRALPMSTEDEAIAVNAGLWIGGAEPLILVQNVGVLASVNALRGIALEQRVPTCMVVGEFGREVKKPVEENASSAVRLLGRGHGYSLVSPRFSAVHRRARERIRAEPP